MSSVRTTILTSVMAPHRVALFNQLAQEPDVDLSIVYAARSDPSRSWDAIEGEMRYRWTVLRQRALLARGESFVHVTSGITPVVRDAAPDVLIVGGWDQPAYLQALALKSMAGLPLAWWVESNLRDRRSESRLMRSIKKRLIASGDGVIVPGVASADYVRSLGAESDRLWVAPNAVDNDYFSSSPRREDGPARFLFVGRLESAKGLAFLLDAWASVPDDATLSIVGSGSLQEAIAYRLTGLPRVQMVGHLERAELKRAYAEADVFVFPSVSDPWGLVINEAMASGLPVIASSAPGAVDDLVTHGDNGLVVPPFDVPALASAMARLASDGSERVRMGLRSRSRVNLFSPKHWAAGMREAITSIAAEAA
jgi:glycosyltransferase involved in cell wall biosynthesis